MAETSAPADSQRRVFRRSPFRLVALAAACLVVVALSGPAVLEEGARARAAVPAGALIAALWLSWRSVRIRRGEDELRLDEHGFTLVRQGGEMRVLWREVPSRFQAVRLWFDTVIVWTIDGSNPPRHYVSYQSRASRGLVRSIPGDHHWSPWLLARIMTEARRRALAER